MHGFLSSFQERKKKMKGPFSLSNTDVGLITWRKMCSVDSDARMGLATRDEAGR